VRTGRAALPALALLGALAACDHAQPFGAGPAEPDVPFSSSFPRRLTFNAGGNQAPSWLPDGSAFIYTYALNRPDHDRCLAILPAEGGHQLRTICHTPLIGDADSTNTLWDPAVGPDSSLAYVRESSLPYDLAPKRREIVVASLAAPDPGRAVVTFPYTAPDGGLHTGASHLAWLGPNVLVYIAEDVSYYTQGTFADTIITPLEIVRADVSTTPATLTAVPGTTGATSLAVDSLRGIIYTLPGDTRVYRVEVIGGAPTVLYDFGAAGVPTEAQVRGSVLVALLGPRLVRATLGDPALVTMAAPDTTQQMGRLALSPSATRLVVELTGAAPADLWLLQVR